jgi:hypothetical protein
MSSNIWTRCAGDSEIRPLRLTAWRIVESQHEVSTRKLVGSAAEQELLEQLIDGVKPPVPAGAPRHHLVFTPFRYPPLRHGSRFGARHERGLWYGSEQQRTAFAEVAYYRLLFLEGSAAVLEPVHTPLTSFTIRMRTERGLDLTVAPFAHHEAVISAPGSYDAPQALGHAMRDAGVELFRFRSARDVHGGTNIGAFTPAVFHQARPQSLARWYGVATRQAVEFTQGGPARRRTTCTFDRAQFLVDGRLPAAAVG